MNDDWLTRCEEALTARTGLRISEHASEPLAAHIRERTIRLSLSSADDYCRLIASDSKEGNDEVRGLLRLLAVPESYFFRDKGQFRLLRDIVIPDLLKKKASVKELRVWSAGCSTGEEAYSLAMLIDEAIRDKAGWKVSIIGTDIREDLLDKARAGRYGNWSFRQVDGPVKARYFKEKDGLLALDPRIMRMVSFFSLDLLDDALPDATKGLYSLDLILCRNVFIYYDNNAVIRMAGKMASVLNDGGYLMTGHGELYSLPVGLLEPKAFIESFVYVKKAQKDSPVDALRPSDEGRLSAPVRPEAEGPKTIAVTEAKKEAQAQDRSAADKTLEVRSLFDRGLYSKAIEVADEALKSAPGDYRLLYLSGAAYANTGDTKKSKELLDAASRADPLAPEPYYLLALIAEQDGDHEGAKERLMRVLYLKSGFVAAYLELASIYESEGDAVKAKKLRLTALAEVRAIPADSQVEMYDNATAREIEAYLSRLTGA